jgi:putative ABC transport system permease protein
MKGIPLAWLQLLREKRRLAAAITGIAFAVVLMLVQLGFEQALFTSVALLDSHLDGDLAMISPQFQSMNAIASFHESRARAALGFDGVASEASLAFSPARWKNPVTRRTRNLFLIGVTLDPEPFDLRAVRDQVPKIRVPGAVLFDTGSRPEFGPMGELLARDREVETEVNGKAVTVSGTFRLGTSFVADANLLTSLPNFHRLVSSHEPDAIDMAILKLRPGADPIAVQAQMKAALPKDVRILTKSQLIKMEKDYWAANTPIGFVFQLGLGMGLIVGLIVVYQILYSDVTDHLSEYATLKAMGYNDRRLAWIVIEEALILSALGFLPGLGFSQIVYTVARNATLLPLRMQVSRVAAVYALTAGMCAGSGLLAVRRLRLANPADIF